MNTIDTDYFKEEHDQLKAIQLTYKKAAIIVCFILSGLLHAALLIHYDYSVSDRMPLTFTQKNINIVLNQASITPQAEQKKITEKSATPLKTKAIPQPIESNERNIETKHKNQSVENIQPAAIEKPSPVKQLVSTAIETEDRAILTDEKSRYLKQVLIHLEQYKYYPLAARRRKLEGEVQITFSLLTDGSIRALTIETPHTVLKLATEKAINRSLPLPSRPEELTDTTEFDIKYSMRYSLTH